MEEDDLEGYHYKWLMPYFTDRLNLAEVQQLQSGRRGRGSWAGCWQGRAVKKVYRVDLPGKEATLFAVALTDKVSDECAGDAYIMERIDFRAIKSSPHLPYEIVVKGNSAYARLPSSGSPSASRTCP